LVSIGLEFGSEGAVGFVVCKERSDVEGKCFAPGILRGKEKFQPRCREVTAQGVPQEPLILEVLGGQGSKDMGDVGPGPGWHLVKDALVVLSQSHHSLVDALKLSPGEPGGAVCPNREV
jgi:hypothetical protein